MDDSRFSDRARSMATSWQTYAVFAALIVLAVAMLIGFDSDRFRPATGSANAMALSAAR